MQDDGGSVMRLEPLEASVELIVVIDRVGVIAERCVNRQKGYFRHLTCAAPAMIGTGVHDQPVEPRVPTLGIAQQRQTAPGKDEAS